MNPAKNEPGQKPTYVNRSVQDCDGASDNKRFDRCHICVLFISFFLLCVTLIEKPIVRGDGWEYLMMTHSIRTQGTVEYSPLASASLQEIARRNPIADYHLPIHEELASAIEEGEYFKFGFLRNMEGDYYPYHFFLYSAVAVPIEGALSLFGLNPLKSLQVTNALLVLSLIVYIYYFSSLMRDEKHLLVAAFLLCGTTYYLLWPHPEVFTAALLMLSVLSWFDGRIVLAIAAAALAANQNPPVALLVPSIFIYHHCSKIAARGGFNWRVIVSYIKDRETWFRSGWMVAAGSLALASPLFYYWHYGVLNPIVAMGGTSTDLITLDRFHSLWLDWNLGVVLGNLGIYCWAGIVVIASLFEFKKTQWLFPMTVFSLVALMTIPALGQGNWNAGGAVYIRYGYWLLVPLLLPVVLLTRSLPRNWRRITGACALALQLALVCHHKVFAWDSAPTKLTGISKSIMKSRPSWYNPIPEIFAERTIGLDGGFTPDRIYQFPASAGIVNKIMIPASWTPTPEELAKGRFSINGSNYVAFSDIDVAEVEGWTYLNGRFERSFPIGERVPHDSGLLGWSGWSTAEAQARWTDSKEAHIVLPTIQRQALQGKLILKGRPYAPEPMQILLNDHLLHSGTEANYPLELIFDPKLLSESGSNRITLVMPEAKPRPELNADTRALGFALEWLVIE